MSDDFTIDGEDYYSQYMPVGMQQIVAPPELMLAQMDYAKVDHPVLPCLKRSDYRQAIIPRPAENLAVQNLALGVRLGAAALSRAREF